jgi:ABC-2 type transport system permease protein
MTAITYTRYEVLRCFRNTRFFIFSLAFPLILFFAIAGPNQHNTVDGVPFPLYYMTGMIAWGSMAAVIAGGARIAAERAVGWTRQMRLTPLSTVAYFRAKILSGYLVALVSILLLAGAGVTLGVHLSALKWFTMIVLILIGLIPFAVLGVLLGHLLTVESMGPALGGLTSLFALLGGAWGPLAQHGAFHKVIECIPSYWLVQAGKTAYVGGGWPAQAWIVMAVWTIVLTRVAMRVYQRDTARV